MNDSNLQQAALSGSLHFGSTGAEEIGALPLPGWVRPWLLSLAVLVVVMVAIGGATRLTGSGLSITEWQPITGAIPPLSESAWLLEFEKYKQSSQYELLNAGMSLSEFQSIYWWEWGHRQFGRLLGFLYVVPMLLLAVGWLKGRVKGSFLFKLSVIGLLGGLQAAVGWIMVASGLEPGMIAVAPVKLMLHLVLASIILGCLIATACGLSTHAEFRASAIVRGLARIIIALLFLQIALGALVAGSKAGLSYNTWPLMDGEVIPPLADLFAVKPWYENFLDNVALVQFQHRAAAYVLLALVYIHASLVKQELPGSSLIGQVNLLLAIVLAQSVLGITALLLVVPLWAALSHQVIAMATLAIAVWHACSASGGRSRPDAGIN